MAPVRKLCAAVAVFMMSHWMGCRETSVSHSPTTLVPSESWTLVDSLSPCPRPPTANNEYVSSSRMFNFAVDGRFDGPLSDMDRWFECWREHSASISSGEMVVESGSFGDHSVPVRMSNIRGATYSRTTGAETVDCYVLLGALSPDVARAYLSCVRESETRSR